MLKRSGGQRQRIWNVLMAATAPVPMAEIVSQAGGSTASARNYLGGLKKHGYVSNTAGAWFLDRKTGPEAPAWSSQTGGFRDWNVVPPMAPAELRANWRLYGGPLVDFCRAIGIHPASTTRLNQMMSGQRPITTNIENAVRNWRETHQSPSTRSAS